MNIRFFITLMAFGGAIVPAGSVAAQHFDVFVGRHISGGQTMYGGIDVNAASVTPYVRVFEAEMGEDPFDGTFTSDEPGFNHPADDAVLPAGAASLVPGDEIFVTGRPLTVGGAISNLFYWNGTGSVVFAPAAGTSFVIDTGNATGSIGSAGAGGAFDDHPFFVLDDGDANPATFPAPGIYLASFQARVANLGVSDSLFLVMGTEGLITPSFLGISQAEFDLLSEDQLDEALEGVIEAAVGYVENNVIPEPCSVILMASAVGSVGFVTRRRRHIA